MRGLWLEIYNLENAGIFYEIFRHRSNVRVNSDWKRYSEYYTRNENSGSRSKIKHKLDEKK